MIKNNMTPEAAYELGIQGDEDALEAAYDAGECVNINEVRAAFEDGLKDAEELAVSAYGEYDRYDER